MQPDKMPTAEDKTAIYKNNRDAMLSILRGTDGPIVPQKKEPDLILRLERVLVNKDTDSTVTFEGADGLEELLKNIAEAWKGLVCVEEDGRLVGLRGRLVLGKNLLVGIEISLGAGGQLVCTCGPSNSIAALLKVIESFDLQVHMVSRSMGCNYELVAEGYNSYVSSPLDIQLVPRTQWTLLTAHQSQTGRYARDVLRCSCSTTITMAHAGDRASLASFRFATALAPLLNFLTDNVRRFRGADARHTPRMVRTMLCNEVDPARYSVVPGTFEHDFSYERYMDWLETLQPVLFEADDGTVTSTAKQTLGVHMSEREYSHSEAARMLSIANPPARLLPHTLQISQADALKPYLVGGYLAFVKGLFRNELTVDTALAHLGTLDERTVLQAAEQLRKNGWEAEVYGQSVSELVDYLIQLSRSSLARPEDQALLNNIAELWVVRMVPRDAFVRQEIKQARGW